MRKENVCKMLTDHTSDCGENAKMCINFDPCNCPKSRSKNIVTTACWRIRRLQTDLDAAAKEKSVSFEKVKGKKVA